MHAPTFSRARPTLDSCARLGHDRLTLNVLAMIGTPPPGAPHASAGGLMVPSGLGRAAVRMLATAALLVVAVASVAGRRHPPPPFPARSATTRACCRARPSRRARTCKRASRTEAVTAGDGAYALAGLRPGTYEITVSLPQYKPQSRTVRVLRRPDRRPPTSPSRPISSSSSRCRSSAIASSKRRRRRWRPTSRRSRSVPAAEHAQLPELRRARAGRARHRRRVPQGDLRAGALSAERRPTSSSTASATRTTSSRAASSARTRAAATRSRRTPCRSSRCSRRTTRRSTRRPSSAIITAVTKSGGNRFTGDIFNLYQDKDLAQNERMVPRRADASTTCRSIEPKPTYERWQWGVVGRRADRQGSRLQFFATYEENRQDRDNRRHAGRRPARRRR